MYQFALKQYEQISFEKLRSKPINKWIQCNVPTTMNILSFYVSNVVEGWRVGDIRLKLEVSHQFFFFSIWVFFYEHSRLTGQRWKAEAISLTPLYHFHPLHRHFDISWVITAESSTLHIASSQTRNESLRLPSASR